MYVRIRERERVCERVYMYILLFALVVCLIYTRMYSLSLCLRSHVYAVVCKSTGRK